MHRLVALLCVVAAFATVATAIGRDEIAILVGRMSYEIHEQELTKLRKRVSEVIGEAQTLSQQICVQLLIPKASVELLGPIEMRTKDLLVGYLAAPQADLDRLTNQEATERVEKKLREAVPTMKETMTEMESCVAERVMPSKPVVSHSSESASND